MVLPLLNPLISFLRCRPIAKAPYPKVKLLELRWFWWIYGIASPQSSDFLSKVWANTVKIDSASTPIWLKKVDYDSAELKALHMRHILYVLFCFFAFPNLDKPQVNHIWLTWVLFNLLVSNGSWGRDSFLRWIAKTPCPKVNTKPIRSQINSTVAVWGCEGGGGWDTWENVKTKE
jgi:hypothetical protein